MFGGFKGRREGRKGGEASLGTRHIQRLLLQQQHSSLAGLQEEIYSHWGHRSLLHTSSGWLPDRDRRVQRSPWIQTHTD